MPQGNEDSFDSMDHVDNVRDPSLLGPFLGERLIEITQTDKDELTGDPRDNLIHFHFGNGGVISFPIGAHGFSFSTLD